MRAVFDLSTVRNPYPPRCDRVLIEAVLRADIEWRERELEELRAFHEANPGPLKRVDGDWVRDQALAAAKVVLQEGIQIDGSLLDTFTAEFLHRIGEPGE